MPERWSWGGWGAANPERPVGSKEQQLQDTGVRKGPEVREFSLRKERGDGEAKETTSGGGAGMVPRQCPSHLDWTQDAEGSTATWGGVTAA